MAIQQINLGSAPAGTGGDTQRAANTKINQNFSNSEHAASRLVGTNAGNVMQVGAFGLGSNAAPPLYNQNTHLKDIPSGFFKYTGDKTTNTNIPPVMSIYANCGFKFAGTAGGHGAALFFPYYIIDNAIVLRTFYGIGNDRDYVLWHDKNTTVDVNKNIKTSSPVLQVFKDRVKKIHEACQLPIKFTRNSIGDYTIEGTTGLRENDWQIVIPKDDHDNQMIAFTMEDDNGTIHLKTYKRIFSMETFLFGPDLSAPVEIPDGLWIDLHLNDLPQEQIDESIE